MGTWSIALYGSDAAIEIRDSCKTMMRAPLREEEIVTRLRLAFPGLDAKDDEDHSDMWLALADQFHAYGITLSTAFEHAIAIIDSGSDIEAKRSCGMDERDLKKRARMLHELRSKWEKPNPRPMRRRVQDKPEQLVFEAGDCVIFPVKDCGKTINPYFPRANADPDWRQDGYGAMAVLYCGHYLGVFAWFAVARLSLFNAQPPSLETCAVANIDSQTGLLAQRMAEKPDICIFGSRLTPTWAHKMQFQTIGRLPTRIEALERELAHFRDPAFVPGACLANELSGFGVRSPSHVPIAHFLRS